MRTIEKTIRSAVGIMAVLTIAVLASYAQRPVLTGTKWHLTHIDGKAVARSNAFLEIGPNERRFSGNAGCNRMFGDVEITGRRIDFGTVATTKMACLDPISNRIERPFTSKLRSVKRFRRTNNTLELLNGAKSVLRFTASTGQNATLESRKWVVAEIAGRSIDVKNNTPFLVFDRSKSSAGGDTGCNLFGGNYEVKGSTIRIYDTVSTMRACIEDDRMSIERQFMNALQTANSYEIKADELLLYRGGRLLIKFKGKDK